MNDAPAPREPPNVDAILEAVRGAAEGIADVRAARAARQTRAACQDVIATLAELGAGSPEAMRLRAGLKELGIASKALDAGLTWWRAHAKGRGPNASDDLRPVIRLDPDALDLSVDAAIEALSADPELYAREGELVRVRRTDARAPVISPHTPASLRVRLARFAKFVDETGSPVLPPEAITAGVLDASELPGLRVLTGIVETPTMRADRTICQTPGYDPAARLLYLPTCDFPEVPEEPTPEQSAAALLFLWTNTSYDFPFRGMGYADPGASSSDPEGVLRFLEAKKHAHAWGIVSGIMTIVGRPGIDGDVPAHLYDATTPGSGKGLSIDVVTLATVGRVLGKITWPTSESHGEADTEVEKRLVGKVMAGSQIIVWDEILRPFGGPSINNILTCGGNFEARPITQPETKSFVYSATMLGAGNNIACRDNTHRRVVCARIESPNENPEGQAGWRVPNLREHVKALRPQLVAAALTVLRGYYHAGAPDAGVPLWGGGYEAWTDIARAIVWAGGGNVLGCRPTSDPDARNEERETIGVIMSAIARLEPKGDDGQPTGDGITSSDVIGALYPPDRLKGQALPDAYMEAREAIEGMTNTASGRKPSAKKLGEGLRPWRNRPVNGRCISVATKKDGNNVQRWTVMRR